MYPTGLLGLALVEARTTATRAGVETNRALPMNAAVLGALRDKLASNYALAHTDEQRAAIMTALRAVGEAWALIPFA